MNYELRGEERAPSPLLSGINNNPVIILYSDMTTELSPDVLAKAADEMFHAEPRLLDSRGAVEEKLQWAFPLAPPDSFHRSLVDGTILCPAVYFTVRFPRDYPPGTCICCVLCKKAVNGIGFHRIGLSIDYCEKCFLSDKSRTFEQYLDLLASEHAHPFVQEKKKSKRY